jgi:vitamin B12 transporter
MEDEMNRIRVSIALSMIFVFFVCAARAQEVRLGEVVVTASRLEEAGEETTSDVTVITGDELRESNAEFITDALGDVPSINLVRNGGDGKAASIFLRGGGSAQSLVMIDGVRVNSPTTGGFDFSFLSVDDIERIEIVKGPQSTVYGSDAMAGVINIITKKGAGKPSISVSAEAGSSGTYKPSLTFSGGTKRLGYRITASYFHTDGISAAKSGSEKDKYENASISGSLSARPGDKFDFEVSGRYTDDTSELDGFDLQTGLAADDPNFVQEGKRYMISARAKHYISDKWEQTLTVSRQKDSLEFSDPDTSFNNSKFINTRGSVDWQHNVYPSDSITLTAGIEYRNDKGESPGNFTEDVDNKAVYLMGKLKPIGSALVLNAGIRYDEYDGLAASGNRATYRAGAVYHIPDAEMSVRASYGTAFRAPSLNDLYYPFYGNPSLRPEKSKGFELGVEKSFMNKKASASVTYFEQKYEDLIQFDFQTFLAANIAVAKVRGVEAETSFKITDSLNLGAGYTYLHTEDAGGQRLPKRPEHKLNASAEYKTGGLSMLADYTLVGRRFDSAAKDELKSYSLVNVSGNYKLTEIIGLFGRIENLLDEDYEEAKGFGTKGVSFYGGIRATY